MAIAMNQSPRRAWNLIYPEWIRCGLICHWEYLLVILPLAFFLLLCAGTRGNGWLMDRNWGQIERHFLARADLYRQRIMPGHAVLMPFGRVYKNWRAIVRMYQKAPGWQAVSNWRWINSRNDRKFTDIDRGGAPWCHAPILTNVRARKCQMERRP
jgi:hypothetical protein